MTINSGNLYQQQVRYEESLQAYNRAIHFRPQLAGKFSIQEIKQRLHNNRNLSFLNFSCCFSFLFIIIEAYSEKAKVLFKLKRWIEAERALLECTRLTTDTFLRDSTSHQIAKVSATILLGDLLSRNV